MVAKTIPEVTVAYSDYAFEGVPATDLLLLAASIRAFGGNQRDVPVLILYDGRRDLPRSLLARAKALSGVRFVPYAAPASFEPYPFAFKAAAAAEAERALTGSASALVWFDRDSVVLGDLGPLMLDPGKSIAFRPVNGQNIGQVAGSEPDQFWAAAYRLGGVDPKGIGTTTSYMEELRLRFYIAAGLLVVRPERGLLGNWARLMQSFVEDPRLTALCATSRAHRIFAHQAALSVAVAADVPPAERQVLSPRVMYPLNFWAADPRSRRPALLDDVITFRYDDAMDDDGWKAFDMSPGLASWLETHLRA